ncbi:hypothetical protein EJ04DRAFT_190058 [Polyplosphaeria fusca]|uniref:Uncharacterized protein n=1 Tax=Polyplosphaeria fusca TaxID=682080 RepID=A0A9P4V4S0_9PLEO|nr:hypothetical protein EJ04DRAFT_190058 [Polyplosphaeria fusca]
MRNPQHSTFDPTTAPRTKRQFQPSITSFFARDARDDRDSFELWEEERGPGPITRSHHHQHHARDRSVATPSLPNTVQADLLSVGMRVRKSVPEGYKTHKPAALPSIQTTLSKSSSPDVYSVKPPREPVPEALQHQRELLPFCGLHKIGGYAEQPVTNLHLYGGTESNGDRPVNLFPLPAEAFNQPFPSQDSTNSSFSTETLPPNPTNPHKRTWQDDDARPLRLNSNFLFANPVKISEDDAPVSPLSENPSQSINSLPLPRTFAQPKSRRQNGKIIEVETGLQVSSMDVDLENARDGEEQRLPNDFGEAEFLRPWSGREIEMGGI